tara:strand:+ start:71 stop:619 length:549 start_codon:yes stop_codon:yes gene_type:complete
MISFNFFKILFVFSFLVISLSGCNGKLPGGDARKFPDDPALRVKKNLEEGRGFRLNNVMKPQGGVFDFASSNELWRASLDAIDFMPLVSANYSGGIIITDWYSSDVNSNESLKITIRFLTNEIRSDAINIKIYNKKCSNNLLNCEIIQTDGVLVAELKRKILKNATILKEEKDKDKKEKKKK